MKIGVVGCGMISGVYLENMINIFDNLEVVGCAAEHFENAEITAKKFGIKAMTLDEIMADPDIEMIVNLTSTNAHYEVISKALKAGKHVYTEKALCETLEQAAEVVALAKTHKLELGCAPETVFGEATQTVKRLIDDGAIGTVTGFHASINLNMNLMYPHFRILNLPGGDIGLDRGIYFLNQLCYLLGEVKDVKGYSMIREPERDLPVKNENGETELKHFTLINKNHMVAAVKMKSGAFGTLNFNGNTIFPELSHLEIQGTKGIVEIPDANHFGGKVRILHGEKSDYSADWEEIETEDLNLRGIGVSLMADAIKGHMPNPVTATRAYHIMTVLHNMSM